MEHQIITAWAGLGIGVGQLIMIGWGLRQMGKVSEDRNRQMGKASEERTLQLDIMREESRGQLDIMREESSSTSCAKRAARHHARGEPGADQSISRYRPGDTRPGDTRPGADPSVSRHRAGDTRPGDGVSQAVTADPLAAQPPSRAGSLPGKTPPPHSPPPQALTPPTACSVGARPPS